MKDIWNNSYDKRTRFKLAYHVYYVKQNYILSVLTIITDIE